MVKEDTSPKIKRDAVLNEITVQYTKDWGTKRKAVLLNAYMSSVTA